MGGSGSYLNLLFQLASSLCSGGGGGALPHSCQVVSSLAFLSSHKGRSSSPLGTVGALTPAPSAPKPPWLGGAEGSISSLHLATWGRGRGYLVTMAKVTVLAWGGSLDSPGVY